MWKRVICCGLLLATAVANGAEPVTIDWAAIPSPVLFKGGPRTAYRDPAALYHNGVFYLYYTYMPPADEGKHCWYTAESRSRDLRNWTLPGKEQGK